MILNTLLRNWKVNAKGYFEFKSLLYYPHNKKKVKKITEIKNKNSSWRAIQTRKFLLTIKNKLNEMIKI